MKHCTTSNKQLSEEDGRRRRGKRRGGSGGREVEEKEEEHQQHKKVVLIIDGGQTKQWDKIEALMKASACYDDNPSCKDLCQIETTNCTFFLFIVVQFDTT